MTTTTKWVVDEYHLVWLQFSDNATMRSNTDRAAAAAAAAECWCYCISSRCYRGSIADNIIQVITCLSLDWLLLITTVVVSRLVDWFWNWLYLSVAIVTAAQYSLRNKQREMWHIQQLPTLVTCITVLHIGIHTTHMAVDISHLNTVRELWNLELNLARAESVTQRRRWRISRRRYWSTVSKADDKSRSARTLALVDTDDQVVMDFYEGSFSEMMLAIRWLDRREEIMLVMLACWVNEWMMLNDVFY